MVGQTHSRGVSALATFRGRLPFDVLPTWSDVRSQSLERQRAIFEDPEMKRRLIEEATKGDDGRALGAEHPAPDYEAMLILDSPLPPYRSVAEVAIERGTSPVEAIIDLSLESDFSRIFLLNCWSRPLKMNSWP